MFLLKKIIAPFFFPLSICIELLIIGVLLLLFTRRLRVAKFVLTAGVVWLVLLSYSFLPTSLLQPLERKHPADQDRVAKSISHVVVLGGGHWEDPALPVTSNLTESSLARVVEGVRLLRKHPDAKLLLSGGAPFSDLADAYAMAQVAEAVGVSLDRIVLESDSRDTAEQAKFLKPILTGHSFLLVTSASHMPRSIALFEAAGLNPIAAPTDHEIHNDRSRMQPRAFFPDSAHIRRAERAIYESLGILWSKIVDEP